MVVRFSNFCVPLRIIYTVWYHTYTLSRILAIDYGSKRTGIAVTDPLRIIATALDTVATRDVVEYLRNYMQCEAVVIIVVGEPKHLDDTPSQNAMKVDAFAALLRQTFPDVSVERYDERFTSKIATERMLSLGLRKKDRRDKGRIDRISATIILEDYLTFKGIF